ncbi:MAG: hypothetical protein Q9N34_10545 [Aquificota bacterium]|nr:hypothetical protein [Aquificota bacterium]
MGGNLLKRLDFAPGRALTTFEEKILLADQNSGKVIVYDANLDRVEGEIDAGHRPVSVDVSPDGRYLFCADPEENRLGICDLKDLSFLGFLEGFGLQRC